MVSKSNLSDEELVRAAQQGALEAFTVLYERHLPSVYKRVRYTVPEQDVDDVTQEIFIAVIKSLKNFRCESQFNTWLRTLVNRQVADYYRRNAQLRKHQDLGDQEEHSEQLSDIDAYNHHADLDESVALRHAFLKLPEQYREVLFLRFADGLRFNEIASMNGKSLEATKSLFRRAVAELRNQVKKANG